MSERSSAGGLDVLATMEVPEGPTITVLDHETVVTVIMGLAALGYSVRLNDEDVRLRPYRPNGDDGIVLAYPTDELGTETGEPARVFTYEQIKTLHVY